MEHYVSFHKVLDYLKQEQQNSPRLNDFGYGDLVYFMNDSGTTTTYPFLFVTPINITYAENTTTYSLQMIFADIVNTDLSNEKDVVSDMSLEARRFLSVVKRGFLDDKIDVVLPSQATTFFERFNDHVGGVVLNADITVFEDINACDPYPVLSPTPTPSVTPTLTPTPTCPITQQYMEVELSESTKFKLALWNDSGFSSPTTALCDYVVSGTAYGDLGTTYTGTETILEGQHQHQFNLSGVLLPGEIVTGFTVYSVNTSTCVCPVNVDFSPYVPPTPTPTPTQTVTPTPTTTPTPTPIPQFNVGAGFSNYTLAVYVDKNNNDEVYVGGNFNWYKNHYQPRIVKIDNSGNPITSFTATTNNQVFGIKDDGLGYLYIYGTFTSVNGQTANRIARISKTDGSLDSNWVGTNANNIVRDVLIDGTDIVLIGNFTTYLGTTVNRVARVSNTNVLDTSAFGTGFNTGEGRSILKNRNGNYVITGNFTSYNGITCGRIIEIDSSTYADTGLFPSTFTDSAVQNIYQDSSNGNYYFIANSGTLNGSGTQKINEIDESANVLQTATFGGVPFQSGWYDETNGYIYGYDTQDLGTDDFYWRWDISTWGFDTTFYNNINNISLAGVTALNNRIVWATNSSGKIYIVGDFDGWANQSFNHIVRVNPDGSLNSTN